VLTICHTQSTTLSSFVSSPLPSVCKQNYSLIPVDADPPFLSSGLLTSRSRIDQETKSYQLFGSLLDPKIFYTGPLFHGTGRMRPACPLLSVVQTSTLNGH
jgi:hypothetical protein